MVNSSITFIFASLNNGYDNNPDDPVQDYHLKRTVYCVNRLAEKHNANIIFVDWCSSEENIFKNYLSKNITYIHIPSSVLLELHKGNESNQNFYEFISKDIGSHFCETENILFTNGDNLFSAHTLKEMNELDTKKYWYSGLRINIESKWFLDSRLETLIEETPHPFTPLHECGFCYGDFMLVSKYNYDEAQGYNYSHVHAYEDTNLANRLNAKGIAEKQLVNPIFHLNHSNWGKHFVSSHAKINKTEIKEYILNNLYILKL